VERLLKLSRLKVWATKLRMESVILKDEVLKMMFHVSQSDKIDGGRLFEIVSQRGRHVGLISNAQIGISFKVKHFSEDEWLSEVEALLRQIVHESVVRGEEQHVAKQEDRGRRVLSKAAGENVSADSRQAL
jgi:transcription-repair coupling factor (superfamily II helicase)